MASILIVDDDKSIRKQLFWHLTDHYLVKEAEHIDQAKSLLHKDFFDIVLVDMHMPPEELAGLRLLDHVRQFHPETISILMTGDKSQEIALKAIDAGAWDLFIKPIDTQALDVVLQRALRLRALVKENEALKLGKSQSMETRIVGESNSIKRLNELIFQIAPTDATVLITGQSGTGKELVAEQIHHHSRRYQKPFIAVNCAALTQSLIEDELFGHEPGSFTGAKGLRRGKFELADKGTLFLDEIAELSPDAQAKLLRVLQEGTMERIGGERTIQVDVRMIAATHQNLQKKVQDGSFREDLFYRLNVIPIQVPALHERGTDIRLLANYYLNIYRKRLNRGPQSFSDAALTLLERYNWPGNVRELRNLVERLVILVQTKVIESSDLPAEIQGIPLLHAQKEGQQTSHKHVIWEEGKSYEDLINAFRKELITEVLSRYKSKTKVAEVLGLNRSYLYDLMEKLQISSD